MVKTQITSKDKLCGNQNEAVAWGVSTTTLNAVCGPARQCIMLP